jgi:hypothetical protein
MKQKAFVLQPFAQSAQNLALQLTGTIVRQGSLLDLSYALQGAVDAVYLPNTLQPPQRQDNLWQTTCFEFFLGLPDKTSYWEFNLSPGGHWNVYRFADYRQGMILESAIIALPIALKVEPAVVSMAVTVDLGPIVPPEQPLEMAVSTVLQSQTGHLSYWALTHPGAEADFHQRDSFTLYLEAD